MPNPDSKPQYPVLHDLSPKLDINTGVWPGDQPFETAWSARIGQDSPVNLGRLTSTLHLAAHADAPLHTEPGGAAIDEMPLDLYVGPALVKQAVIRDGLVQPESMPDGDTPAPDRLLLKTGCQSCANGFPEQFTAIAPETALAIADRGIRLVGTDAPSVDPLESKTLLSHHALLGNGVAILEGLELAEVPEGMYELIALPLRLVGMDASPVRAVLRG